jgi:hypothetical protein
LSTGNSCRTLRTLITLRTYGLNPLRSIEIPELVDIRIKNQKTGSWREYQTPLLGVHPWHQQTLVCGIKIENRTWIRGGSSNSHVVLGENTRSRQSDYQYRE